MSLPELHAAFIQKHPEAGNIRVGAHVSVEQLQYFSAIVGDKVMELSKKSELTKEEATFVDRTMDLGTRSVIYAHERLGLPIPESENTVTVAMGIARLQGEVPAPQNIVYGLHSITGSTYVVRSNSELQEPIAAIGYGSVHMLAEMAESTDGITIDSYLEGNLQNIAAHLEQVEQQ